jgi:glycerophosphoryl diester phosphodiesterase
MAFLDNTAPIAMAHRGFSPDGGENSLSAFQRAVDIGYRYVETDVRVTSDGVALAFHDSALDRVTDMKGLVIASRWSSVRHARIGGVEPIPQLAEVLDSWPDLMVNIDVKSDAGVAPTVDVIRRINAGSRVCVGAFSDRRIARLRASLPPDVCTSIGPAAAVRLCVASRRGLGPFARRGDGRCAQLPARIGRRQVIDARLLTAAHERGLKVHAWTVNEPTEMIRLLDLGVDGIITDCCDVLRDVLIGRDQWPSR